MKRTFILLIAGLTAALILSSTALPVQAQQITLSMSPPIVETLIKPGKTILIGYTVQNMGDPTTLAFQIRSFTPQGEFGEMKIDDELATPIRFSLDNSDIELEKPFFVKQRDGKQALVRIRVPEGTPEGDYYFLIMATSYPVPAIGGSTASLAKATIGSTLLVTVTKSGSLEANGRISLFRMEPDFTFRLGGKEYRIVESGSRVPVTLFVQNLGRNLIKPQGDITVRGPFNTKTVYNLIPQNVLAQSSRLVKAEGRSSDRATLLAPGYFIGPYTLSARVSFGENTPQLYANTTFIGLPLRLMAAVLGVILVSVLIIVFNRRRKE